MEYLVVLPILNYGAVIFRREKRVFVKGIFDPPIPFYRIDAQMPLLGILMPNKLGTTLAWLDAHFK